MTKTIDLGPDLRRLESAGTFEKPVFKSQLKPYILLTKSITTSFGPSANKDLLLKILQR